MRQRTHALSASQEASQPWLTPGNAKLGHTVPTFSLLAGRPSAGGSCPGATTWCHDHCYAKRGRLAFPSVRERYRANWGRLLEPGGYERFTREVPRELRLLGAGACRIHVSGDFFSPAYVEAWSRIVRASPRVRFWAYTRSWRSPGLRAALEELRRLPNVQLFASVDGSTREDPPPGWRVAMVEHKPLRPHRPARRPLASRSRLRRRRFGGKGLLCPHQTGKQPNCASCTYCFIPIPPTSATSGNVVFREH